MRRSIAATVLASMLICAPLFAQEKGVQDVALWSEGQDGVFGWGGAHNATLSKDAEGIVLKAGTEGDYGSYFRRIGEVDLDSLPYFLVEVDRAEGRFGAKLINEAKKDKQVIFEPTAVDGVVVTHIPAQTGWSGKAPLSLGIYCHAAGKSLRIKRIQFLAQPSPQILGKFIQARNLIFDASFESGEAGKPPVQTWHRMGSYLPSETPWRVISGGAYDGDKCLKTEKPGRFVIQREIHGKGVAKYTFSVYLKAAREGADASDAEHRRHPTRARLLFATYRQGKPITVEPNQQDVKVGADWGRYSMTIEVPSVRNRGVLGPVDLGVESLDEGELRLDAMQLEVGEKPLLFGKNDGLIVYKPVQDLRSPLYPPIPEPKAPEKAPPGEAGKVRLRVLGGPQTVPADWPMVGVVTLPQGKSCGVNTWRITSPKGGTRPSQVNVLSRWQADGSIKCAQVIAESDGSSEYTLEITGTQLLRAASPLFSEEGGRVRGAAGGMRFVVDREKFRGPEFVENSQESGFRVTSFDGRRFAARAAAAATAIEENGPVRAAIRVEGDHRSETGDHLLSYVARIYAFRSQPLVRVEYTWINTNASPTVAIGSMAWRFALGPMVPGTLKRLKVPGTMGLRLADGRTALIEVEDFQQSQPIGVAVDKDSAEIQFWPPGMKAVELTRGMSKTYTVDLWLGPDASAPEGGIEPLTLVAEPAAAPPQEATCASGVFGGELLASEGSPFPLFEKVSVSPAGLGHMSQEYLETNKIYGQFNYGDTYGDGGWANMETQLDHAMWLHFIRTGNPAFFKIAQAASRHYRDVDIDQITGATYTHNLSHTLGGKSTSHAWIQGTLDHYMVTGERRAMEVALLHANFLKNLPLEELTSGGREVTRILDNFADLYTVTGDEALLRRHDEICAFQRENIAKGKSRFPGLFQHNDKGTWVYTANFVPWYGLCSLAKLRLATGDEKWQRLLLEETAHALSATPFKYARPEYFEGNPLSDDERIVRCLGEGAIGDRGNMLFPALGYAWRWGKDKRCLEIGMSAVYISMICGEYRDPLFALAAVFLEQARQAGMTEADEKRYYQKAVDIMQRAAHPALANPGFEEGTKYWAAWRVKSSSSGYWVPVRKGCLLMDPDMKKEGAQGLHIVLTRQNPPMGFGVPLDSDDFILQAGKAYQIEGWLRETGEIKTTIGLRVRPLAIEAEPVRCETKFSTPDADGWRRWTIEGKIDQPSIGQVTISVARKSITATGEAWVDGVVVK